VLWPHCLHGHLYLAGRDWPKNAEPIALVPCHDQLSCEQLLPLQRAHRSEWRQRYQLQRIGLYSCQAPLVEQAWQSVPAEQLEEYLRLLDAPPGPNQRLRRTMAAPRPWKA
jgi:hypothetical protein